MHRSYAQSHTINPEQLLFYKRAALICLGIIGVSAVLYAYALCSTIHFVIARSGYQKEAQVLSAQIGSLQVEYLSKAQSVNLDTGATLGLHEANKISFVSLTAPTVSKVVTDSNEL